MNLKQLINSINNDDLLGDKVFKDLDLDEVLDARDEEHFDKSWIETFKLIDKLTLKRSDAQLIDNIREISFKKTYKYCEDSDLAACVSDDFELIAKALYFNLSDPFINSLWISYKNHNIPRGKVELVMGSIREL
jgi:hypothetical protein